MVTKPGAYYFNGTKAVNINNLPEEAWTVISGGEKDDSDITKVYKESAFFRRCVDVRGLALSNLPRDIVRDGEAIPEDELSDAVPQLNDLDDWLFQIEVAMTLYAQAYLLKQQNALRDEIAPRWLAPKSIKPKYNNTVGLSHFERTRKGQEPEKLEPEEIVYFWTPPIDAEVGPGPAEGKAAIDAASVLDSSTNFARQFFVRGAVFPILLSVDGNPPRSEMDKLEIWWKRLLRGVKDAWETVAIKASVKPEIIGPPVSEMAMRDLTEIQRENVATALGVPHSIVMSNAANFAVSHQDYINFYDMTLNPRAKRVAKTFNNQYLNELGLRLVFRPERLEVFQKQNLETADQLVSLVTGKVLERNEARDMLGYEPLEDDPEADDEQPIVMQLPRQPEAQPAEDAETLRRVDLEKWQRKSLSAFKSNGMAAAPFESDVIADDESMQILNELSLCFSEAEVKAVFSERNGH